MIIGLIRPTYYTPTTVGLFASRKRNHLHTVSLQRVLSELSCSVGLFENTCFGVNELQAHIIAFISSTDCNIISWRLGLMHIEVYTLCD